MYTEEERQRMEQDILKKLDERFEKLQKAFRSYDDGMGAVDVKEIISPAYGFYTTKLGRLYKDVRSEFQSYIKYDIMGIKSCDFSTLEVNFGKDEDLFNSWEKFKKHLRQEGIYKMRLSFYMGVVYWLNYTLKELNPSFRIADKDINKNTDEELKNKLVEEIKKLFKEISVRKTTYLCHLYLKTNCENLVPGDIRFEETTDDMAGKYFDFGSPEGDGILGVGKTPEIAKANAIEFLKEKIAMRKTELKRDQDAIYALEYILKDIEKSTF